MFPDPPKEPEASPRPDPLAEVYDRLAELTGQLTAR
jgi:hypothetical protein